MTLRDIRLRAGVTQLDLSAACNVTQGAVSQWETGLGPPRKYHDIICRKLDISADDLRQAIADQRRRAEAAP